MDSLKRCPFCWGKAPIAMDEDRKGAWNATCLTCCAQGPKASTVSIARRAWNRGLGEAKKHGARDC